MQINLFVESILLLILSTFLIRLAGKKSIAKMTGLEVVIILAIGTTMGHAIKEYKFWEVIMVLSLFVIYLLFVQFLQLKFHTFERYLIGSAIVVIKDGQIVTDSLKKLRLTKEQLEMKLRQKGISFISDVKVATIESDGGVGYELMKHAQPITYKELTEILGHKSEIQNQPENKHDNLFNKIL